MPIIAVSPLSQIAEVAVRMKAREMISLLAEGHDFHRPAVIAKDRHLNLAVNDVVAAGDGLVTPEEVHVQRIIEFARSWDQTAPLLVHCWFGVSRSPAAALVAALAVKPELDEEALALSLRKASPQASPNLRIVALGDKLLGRGDRLLEAVSNIGRGADFVDEAPFSFEF